MFPESFEEFTIIPEDGIQQVGEDMNKLNTKLDLLPVKIDESIIKNMYGKMEIHDNVMDIYNTNGELIRTFNLYDYNGQPTTTSGVFKREIKEVIP